MEFDEQPTGNAQARSQARAEGRKIEMKVIGKFERDDAFTTIFCEGVVYTIARNTGEWSFCKVGETTFSGQILTEQVYRRWEENAEEIGVFFLD